jgi:acyl carrier protein
MTETIVPEHDQILLGIREAIGDVLDADDLARIRLDDVRAETPLLSLPIDSMALMEIMKYIEDRFRVYIPDSKAYEFTAVGEVIDFVHEKAVAKASRQRS